MPNSSEQLQPPELSIRPARLGDEQAIFHMIRQLARYERLESAVTGSAEALREHLFGARPVVEALLALERERAVGYALFFPTYSTFMTKPGLYLEDLFVLEEERGRGIGRALLSELRALASARGAGRLEWTVLDWNQTAIAFYEHFGARVLPDWRVCRIDLPEPHP
ncbi:MAG TPA: GNAT family N-acetyltransferase [Polyangiaceae bacterium]|nr:GNAT family N-acetyltransferase [Polyangiaceae bacterium]